MGAAVAQNMRVRRITAKKLAEYALSKLFPGSRYLGVEKRKGRAEVRFEIIDTREAPR